MGRIIYWLLVAYRVWVCTADDQVSLDGFPEVAVGASHTITCNHPGGSEYVWKSPKGVTSNGYSLTFTAIHTNDNGLWQCEVTVNGKKKIGKANLFVYCSGKFVTSTSSTNPSLGDPIELKCRLNNPSGQEVQWQLTTPGSTGVGSAVAAVQEKPNTCRVYKENDNRKWSPSTVCQTSSTNHNFNLMILSARKSDEGYWSCIDFGNTGCYSRPVRIGIAKPPRDPPSLTGLSPIFGTNHALTCNAWQPFVRPLTYTWFKDNVQITKGNSSSWLLSPVAKENMGKYRCEVEDKITNTNVKAEKALTVYYCRKGWSGFQGECYKRFTTKKVFKEAEASCVTYGGHLSSVCSQDVLKFIVKLAGRGDTWIGSEVYYPTGRNPNLVWTDGSNCPDWRKLLPTLAGVDFKDKTRTPGHKDAARLNIADKVTFGDIGYDALYTFVCKAKPMLPPKDPPTLTGFTNPIEGTRDHTLTCDAWHRSVGALAYSWFKDGVLVQKGNHSTLTLDHVVKSSKGEYSCVVTDTVTDAKVQAKELLDVYYPPAWNPATPHVAIEPTVPGGRVHLTLDVIANPVPSSIKWFYEKGNSLTQVTYAILTMSATVRVLIITSVQEKDFGTYKVEATNAVGSAQFTFSIAKINIPAVPTELTVVETGKDFLLVSFQADDSGSAHQTFTIVFYEEDKYHQIIEGIIGPADATTITYKIRHLAPDTRYYIKVKAVHDFRFRQSSYSDVVEAETLLDASNDAATIADGRRGWPSLVMALLANAAATLYCGCTWTGMP